MEDIYLSITIAKFETGFNVAGAYAATSFVDISAYSRVVSVAIGAMGGNYIFNVSGFALGDKLVTNPFAALSRTVSDIAKGKGSMVEYGAAGVAGYGTYQVKNL